MYLAVVANTEASCPLKDFNVNIPSLSLVKTCFSLI